MHDDGRLALSFSEFVDGSAGEDTAVILGRIHDVQRGEAVVQRLTAAVIWNTEDAPVTVIFSSILREGSLFISSRPFRYQTTTRFGSFNGVNFASR